MLVFTDREGVCVLALLGAPCILQQVWAEEVGAAVYLNFTSWKCFLCAAYEWVA